MSLKLRGSPPDRISDLASRATGIAVELRDEEEVALEGQFAAEECRNEEELRVEVVDVVCGKQPWRLTADGQAPAGEVTRIAVEKLVGLGRRCIDVTTAIADDERIAFEDADGLARHSCCLW